MSLGTSLEQLERKRRVLGLAVACPGLLPGRLAARTARGELGIGSSSALCRLTFNGIVIETGVGSCCLAGIRARTEEPANAG
ncbi:hypothetical protein AQJ23_17350 [Streptomyces antibioticus]|nr:hypothetical protein [Streptomyces antibioticus]KUN25132.1 hypothetical protein AQJ23_17350 [Streptomyces antibioticus]